MGSPCCKLALKVLLPPVSVFGSAVLGSMVQFCLCMPFLLEFFRKTIVESNIACQVKRIRVFLYASFFFGCQTWGLG